MENKKYTKDHDWVSLVNDIATVGITNHAQESLGDIVFIDLPKINKIVKAGDQVGIVESVKAASELYSPVSGAINTINDKLLKTPQLLNTNAENTGWYMKIKIKDIKELDQLMNFDSYKKIMN